MLAGQKNKMKPHVLVFLAGAKRCFVFAGLTSNLCLERTPSFPAVQMMHPAARTCTNIFFPSNAHVIL